MKRKFQLPVVCFGVILLGGVPRAAFAQDKEKPELEQVEEEPGDAESQEKLSPEQLQELRDKYKAKQEADKAKTAKMMKVFTSLEGEWVGQEALDFEDESEPDLKWKDEWKGEFKMGGKYFEMTGKTAGEDMNSEYRWICTYDPEIQRYRAWYFGDNSMNQYTGTLSDDGKNVVWRTRSRLNGSESEFTMKADGNRVKCHGTDKLANGDLFSTQTSEYTKKRVEL